MAEEESSPHSELDDLIMGGLMRDIWHAEEAVEIAKQIGECAPALNRSQYGPCFGAIQDICSRHDTMAAARLFDPVSRRYPTRSIPALVSLLETHAETLEIEDRGAIERALRLHRIAIPGDAAAVTRSYCQSIRRRIDEDLAPPLERVRFARDKRLAHNERPGDVEQSLVKWGDTRLLVAYAKNVTVTVGAAYRSMMLASNDEYEFTWDAQIAGKQLRDFIDRALALFNVKNDPRDAI